MTRKYREHENPFSCCFDSKENFANKEKVGIRGSFQEANVVNVVPKEVKSFFSSSAVNGRLIY